MKFFGFSLILAGALLGLSTCELDGSTDRSIVGPICWRKEFTGTPTSAALWGAVIPVLLIGGGCWMVSKDTKRPPPFPR